MQKLTLAGFAAACLLAAPAIAQTTSNTQNNGANNTASSSSASQQPMSQADLQKLEQKITNELQSDGYTNIQVMPNSFLVHATNKHNDKVMMIINPDSVFAVTQVPGKQASTQSPSSSTTTKQ